MDQNKSAARSFFEPLEGRTLMSAGGSFVYVESNNPNAGQNAVLAYNENPTTGALTALPHGRYLTGGTGFNNDADHLGPDDSDKEIIASPDGRFLYAVNQGSNTVSVFTINADGSLTLTDNSPTYSGGTEPVSLSFNNDRLYVVNRGNGYEGGNATIAPNVSTFFAGEDGTIFQYSTTTLPLNLSTAQVLSSADGKFAFVDNFATPSNLKVSLANTVEPFVINGDGTLTAVKNGAAGLPVNPPLVLGLVEDPIHHVIYTGQAPVGGVATFSYNDTTGAVKFVTSVASPGKATCWLNISPNGKYLYATDSASDAISVYSLANPLKPALVQEFYLNGPTVKPGSSTAAGPTSQDFQFSFDPTGQYLWVLNHTTDSTFQQGNQLHTLVVGANGKLSEPSVSPQYFSTSWVPSTAHVLGLAVVTPDQPLEAVVTAQVAARPASFFAAAPAAAVAGPFQPQVQQLHRPLVRRSVFRRSQGPQTQRTHRTESDRVTGQPRETTPLRFWRPRIYTPGLPLRAGFRRSSCDLYGVSSRRRNGHPIAPRFLGIVHRIVGPLKQRTIVRIGCRGDTKAGRHLQNTPGQR